MPNEVAEAIGLSDSTGFNHDEKTLESSPQFGGFCPEDILAAMTDQIFRDPQAEELREQYETLLEV